MAILYSNVESLIMGNQESDFIARFRTDCLSADEVKIASGYASENSLNELNRLIHGENCCVRKITVVLGMYFRGGIPESIYQTALRINRQWLEEDIGEIRLVIPFNYHGKLYMFYCNDNGSREIKECYVGSHNLSATTLTNNNSCQYEISSTIANEDDLNELNELMERLCADDISTRIDLIEDIRRIQPGNNRGNSNVTRTWLNVTNEDIAVIDDETEIIDGNDRLMTREEIEMNPAYAHYYGLRVDGLEYHFPINVGQSHERSNINVCYAIGRPRNWYEMQIGIREEYRGEGFPERDSEKDENPRCFMLLTDDGNMFLAHTTSGNAITGKTLSAVGNDSVLGQWFKRRFVDAGLVQDTLDFDAEGNPLNLITPEMLEQLGIRNFVLYGTSEFIRIVPSQVRIPDRNGRIKRYSRYDREIEARVWLLTVE